MNNACDCGWRLGKKSGFWIGVDEWVLWMGWDLHIGMGMGMRR